MTTDHRHILERLCVSFIIITLCLTAGGWALRAFDLLDWMINRDMPFSALAPLIAYTIPLQLSLLIPVSGFAAAFWVYQELVHNREILALESAGRTPMYIFFPALAFSASLAALVALLCLAIEPRVQRAYEDHERYLRTHFSATILVPGLFSEITPGVTATFERRGEDGILHGLFIHDQRDQRKALTLIAARGRLTRRREGIQLDLNEGAQQIFDSKTQRLALLKFSSYTLSLDDETPRLAPDRRAPKEWFTKEVWAQRAGPEAETMRVILHYRLSQPLLALGLPLLAALAVSRKTAKPTAVLGSTTVLMATVIGHRLITRGGKSSVDWIPLSDSLAILPCALALGLLLLAAGRWWQRPGAPPADAGAASMRSPDTRLTR